MTGLQNFLTLLRENWTTICAFISITVALYFKIKHEVEKWQNMDEAQQKQELERAKEMLADYILGLCARAEVEWAREGSGLGKIKRSEVIQKVYDAFPDLAYAMTQEEMTTLIDTLIEKALETVRETIRKPGGDSDVA